MVDYAAEIARMERESGILAAIHRFEIAEHRRVNQEIREILRQAIIAVNGPWIQLCADIRGSMNRSE
jgi:hypothetical protein